ncbi:hypothetical protein ACVBEH_04515 [Roseateles sp. GG27B]
MKLVTYRKGSGPLLTGVVVEAGVLDISAWLEQLPLSAEAEQHNAAAGIAAPNGGIMRWLQSGTAAIAALGEHLQAALSQPAARFDPLSEIQLYVPVPRPGKIIGVGRNYADHAKETGVKPFETPRIIFKTPSPWPHRVLRSRGPPRSPSWTLRPSLPS